MRLVHIYLQLFLAQLLLQVTYGADISACPECGTDDDWIRADDEPFCYNITHFPSSSNWKDFDASLNYCAQKEANLPILKSKQNQENFKSLDQVKRNYTYLYFYIGLNKSAGGQWMWLDNTECTPDQLSTLFTPDRLDIIVYYQINPTGGKFIGLHGGLRKVEYVYCQKSCPLATTPTTTHQGGAQGTGSSGLGLGVIIGIAAGGAVLLLLLIIAAVVLVKRKRAAGIQHGEQSGTVTGKDDPGAGIATKDLFCGTEADQTGIGTKDLFCGTEADQTGIGTKELFNATEADNASNASLHLQSVDK